MLSALTGQEMPVKSRLSFILDNGVVKEVFYSVVRNHAKLFGDNEEAIKELMEKLKEREDVEHRQPWRIY